MLVFVSALLPLTLVPASWLVENRNASHVEMNRTRTFCSGLKNP